jgi:cob(I)alamin adenosyltransferase
MSESKPFNEPRSIILNRIYTRGGDRGQTSLVGGQRVDKDDLRIETYGTVDELNSFIGLARISCNEAGDRHPSLRPFSLILTRVQHELFNLGSILATMQGDVHPKQPRVGPEEIQELEREIDFANDTLPSLRSFVLPGGSRLSAELHVCRTVCRRAERVLVALSRRESVPADSIQYLNRLSDALFVWSRWVNVMLGADETLWQPNAAASGTASASDGGAGDE